MDLEKVLGTNPSENKTQTIKEMMKLQQNDINSILKALLIISKLEVNLMPIAETKLAPSFINLFGFLVTLTKEDICSVKDESYNDIFSLIQDLVLNIQNVLFQLVPNTAILYELKESESIFKILKIITSKCPDDNEFIRNSVLIILERIVDTADSLFIDYLHKNVS